MVLMNQSVLVRNARRARRARDAVRALARELERTNARRPSRARCQATVGGGGGDDSDVSSVVTPFVDAIHAPVARGADAARAARDQGDGDETDDDSRRCASRGDGGVDVDVDVSRDDERCHRHRQRHRRVVRRGAAREERPVGDGVGIARARGRRGARVA